MARFPRGNCCSAPSRICICRAPCLPSVEDRQERQGLRTPNGIALCVQTPRGCDGASPRVNGTLRTTCSARMQCTCTGAGALRFRGCIQREGARTVRIRCEHATERALLSLRVRNKDTFEVESVEARRGVCVCVAPKIFSWATEQGRRGRAAPFDPGARVR